MRVLLANKFYYPRGGDCIYLLNLEALLRRHGHETAVFAMRHPENLDTPWARYFPAEVTFAPSPQALLTVARLLGLGEVRRRFEALLDAFRPDVVHLNNVHTQLSPVLAERAHRRGIRTVWTLHDYKLLCPRYDCLRNGRQICRDCYADKRSVLKYRCVKNSRVASWLAYWEARRWNRNRLEAATDRFVSPSRFLAEQMAEGGFRPDKISVLCNFLDPAKCRDAPTDKEDYFCFAGRLSPEKGLFTLLEAAAALPYRLKIAGTGPLLDAARALASPRIEFLGHRSWEELKQIVGRARFTVVPSEWPENNPLVVIESQSLGTPVLGARIGGIPELVEEGVSGMTFEPGNVADLQAKIAAMFAARYDYRLLATNARRRYDADRYLERILAIYRGDSAAEP